MFPKDVWGFFVIFLVVYYHTDVSFALVNFYALEGELEYRDGHVINLLQRHKIALKMYNEVLTAIFIYMSGASLFTPNEFLKGLISNEKRT